MNYLTAYKCELCGKIFYSPMHFYSYEQHGKYCYINNAVDTYLRHKSPPSISIIEAAQAIESGKPNA